MKFKILLTAFSLALLLAGLAHADDRHFNLFTVEVGGVKMWVPSSIHVKKGDKVTLTLASRVADPKIKHGFMLPAFGITEEVDAKGKTVTFKADKEGIFDFQCHLHPAHVGGQLIVLPN